MISRKLADVFILLYVVSLPFYSLRFTSFEVSICLVFLLLVSMFSIKNSFKAVKLTKKYLIALMGYLLIAAASVFYTGTDFGAIYVLLKTLVYVGCFVYFTHALFLLMSSKGEARVEQAVQVSVLLYSIFFIYVVFDSGAWRAVSGGFSYWTFTYQVYGSMNLLLFGDTGFGSADVMRNTIAEVFVVFSIVLLGRVGGGRKLDQLLLMVCVLLILVTFSRRALVELSLCFAMYFYVKRSFKLVFSIGLMSVLLYFSLGASGAGSSDVFSRFGNLAEDGRFDQFAMALSSISDNFVTGLGYGAKLNGEKYVHNMVLASVYMMGILGGCASLYILFVLARDMLRSVFSKRQEAHAVFLVVPLVGSQVGSTVEGLFTPGGWLAISFFIVGNCFSSRSYVNSK